MSVALIRPAVIDRRYSLQIANYRKRQDRHHIGYRDSPAFVTKLAAGEKFVRVIERNRLGKIYNRILPSLSHRRKTDARRNPRRDHDNPFVMPLPAETNAAIGKVSARPKRQIISALEKIGMFAAKLQHALSQKHFDPAIRPILQKFFRFCFSNGRDHLATTSVIDRTPIIRIDQREVPNLVALINVGHAW